MTVSQNTPEWAEFRRRKIGASDAPIIMGVSPYKTKRQLWDEKLGLKESPAPHAGMKRGHELEKRARQAMEQLTGLIVEPKVVQHSAIDWAIASLDGVSLDGKIFIEIKCLSREKHEMALRGEIPSEYYPQLQHQWWCMPDAKEAFYVSYHPDYPDENRCKLIFVEKNEKYIEDLHSVERDFWNSLETLTPPPDDYVEQESLEWINVSASYLECQRQLKVLTEQESLLRDQLIAISGGCNSRGGGLSISQVRRRGNISYTSIPELKGIDLERYRKPDSTYWKIDVQ